MNHGTFKRPEGTDILNHADHAVIPIGICADHTRICDIQRAADLTTLNVGGGILHGLRERDKAALRLWPVRTAPHVGQSAAPAPAIGREAG